MNTNTKCKQWRMPFLLILFTLFFLLVILREIWCIRLKSRLDQPAQRISGLFPTAVL